MHFYHLKEVMKPVWPAVHLLWVGRVYAGSMLVLIHPQKLIVGCRETQPCNLKLSPLRKEFIFEKIRKRRKVKKL